MFLTVLALFSMLFASFAQAQLSTNFYVRACPRLPAIVRGVMTQTVRRNPRMGASILRLFFHDCFVNVNLKMISFLYYYLFELTSKSHDDQTTFLYSIFELNNCCELVR